MSKLTRLYTVLFCQVRLPHVACITIVQLTVYTRVYLTDHNLVVYKDKPKLFLLRQSGFKHYGYVTN